MSLFWNKEDNILIEEYSKNPINNKEMEDFSVKYHEWNFICGDDITVFLKIADNLIKDYSYVGNLSIVSLSVASFLSELLIDININDILNWDFEFLKKQWFDVSNRRKRAATLPLLAVRNAIHEYLNDWIVDDFDDLLD